MEIELLGVPVCLCVHPLRCFHLFEETQPHLVNGKVVSPYPIFFACAFKVVELLYLPPRQRPHNVFFFSVKCQKQYLTCENLAAIQIFVHIMKNFVPSS